MSSRDSLHRLIEDLPESELVRAERVLEVLKETAEGSLHTLENAPDDDVLETPEEAAAVAQAWQEHRAGKSLTTKELKRDLGLE